MITRFSKEDILSMNKLPIKINDTWYIVEEVETNLPYHMWIINKENLVDLYGYEDMMLSIKVAGTNTEKNAYYLWEEFNKTWTAYGYTDSFPKDKLTNGDNVRTMNNNQLTDFLFDIFLDGMNHQENVYTGEFIQTLDWCGEKIKGVN